MNSGRDAGIPSFVLSYLQSGRYPCDNSAVSMVVYGPSLVVLDVQSLHLGGCHATAMVRDVVQQMHVCKV